MGSRRGENGFRLKGRQQRQREKKPTENEPDGAPTVARHSSLPDIEVGTRAQLQTLPCAARISCIHRVLPFQHTSARTRESQRADLACSERAALERLWTNHLRATSRQFCSQ